MAGRQQLTQSERLALRDFLIRNFDVKALKDLLTYDLEVDPESFDLSSKQAFVRECIAFFERRNREADLIEKAVLRAGDVPDAKELQNILVRWGRVVPSNLNTSSIPARSSSSGNQDKKMTTPKPIFICYAHEDNSNPDPSKRWLNRLVQFLQPLAQQDELSIFSDQEIGIGDDWHADIQKHLDKAHAAVLLVSPAFLASPYIRNSELPVLLQNAKAKGVKIIPIIVKRCLFVETKFKYPDPKTGPQELSLASLQSSNSPSQPLSALNEDEQDQVLQKVAQALIKLGNTNPN